MLERRWVFAITAGLAWTVAANGQVLLDMPPPPALSPAEELERSSDEASLGQVALARYSGARTAPSNTYLSSWPSWGWPYGRLGYGYGYGYPFRSVFGWGRSYGYGWWGWPSLGYGYGGRRVFFGVHGW